jgi:hypothetical protein
MLTLDSSNAIFISIGKADLLRRRWLLLFPQEHDIYNIFCC